MGFLNAIRCSYGALRILSWLTKPINLFCRRFDRTENCAARTRAAIPPGRLNGQALSPLGALPYGAWTMAYNGCEVIAVYNALLVLRRGAPLLELTAELERRGLLFNGYGGTNLSAVASCLRSRGVEVTVLRRRERERFDAALAGSGCAILSYWTGRRLRRADGSWNTLHTVSVQRSFAGVEVCNCESDWPAPRSAKSIADFLRREEGEPVCLFALKAVDKTALTGYNPQYVKCNDGQE